MFMPVSNLCSVTAASTRRKPVTLPQQKVALGLYPCLSLLQCPQASLPDLLPRMNASIAEEFTRPALLTTGQMIYAPDQPSHVFPPSIAPVNFDEIV
jgi:hypothetical protein